ncbi:MAG: CRISPR-associated endonuclease Cas2 [Corynebacterium sp.]|nr:CRISPR-associated endonuclease Cas2 [Corynebacterium sp.]
MKDKDANVWLLTLFDLPVGTLPERRAATKFRQHLLDIGFSMLQFSCYIVYVPKRHRVPAIIREVKEALPGGGDVRIVVFTDHQWQTSFWHHNSTTKQVPAPPDQLTIF